MTLGAGETFAGYTILGQLGAGGMGEVYLAQHPRLPRHEALKILRTDISNDDSFRQRFIREADSIAALAQHRHRPRSRRNRQPTVDLASPPWRRSTE